MPVKTSVEKRGDFLARPNVVGQPRGHCRGPRASTRIALKLRHYPARERLAAAGYDDRGDLANSGGVIVAKGPPAGRTHILHLVERSDPQWHRWLVFRNELKRDDRRRNEYGALKKELAARYPLDRPSYVAGKRNFIRETVDST
jgi:GrpB-like predicted nucleotidyltransferase (UPF0157 family)